MWMRTGAGLRRILLQQGQRPQNLGRFEEAIADLDKVLEVNRGFIDTIKIIRYARVVGEMDGGITVKFHPQRRRLFAATLGIDQCHDLDT